MNIETLLEKMSAYLENEADQKELGIKHEALLNNISQLASQSMNDSKYHKEQLEFAKLLQDTINQGKTNRDDKFVIQSRLKSVVRAADGIKRHNLIELKEVTETALKVLRQDFLAKQNDKSTADRLSEQNLAKAKIASMSDIELNNYVNDLPNADNKLSAYEYYLAKTALKNADNQAGLSKLEAIKTQQNTLEPWKNSKDYHNLSQKLNQAALAERDQTGYILDGDKVIDPQKVISDFAKSDYDIQDPSQRDKVAQQLQQQERNQCMQKFAPKEKDDRTFDDRLAEQVSE